MALGEQESDCGKICKLNCGLWNDTDNEARCHVIPRRLLIAAATLRTRAERNKTCVTAERNVSSLVIYPAVVAVTPLKKMEKVVRLIIPCFVRPEDIVGTRNSTNSFSATATLSKWSWRSLQISCTYVRTRKL